MDKTNYNKTVRKAAEAPHLFIFFGDFLYWKADVEGTEYAEAGTYRASFPQPKIQIKGNTAKREGKWEPGLRLGTGYEFGGFDEWELSLVWTHLKGQSKKSSRSASLSSNPFIEVK